MKEALRLLAAGRTLPPEVARRAMEQIITGEASPAMSAAFLVALRTRGETPAEIAAFCSVLSEHAVRISPRVSGTLTDTCGTGGDGASTFNVSTAAAIVAAAAGVPVVKHGNRAVSSRCGSADVLEVLGVTVDLPPAAVCRLVEEIGIGFLFAPAFHPAFRNVAAVRRELGIETVFNILGPLLNPAGAPARLLGVSSPTLVGPVAEALRILGVRRALVVHGSGIDEITVAGETLVAELNGGRVEYYALSPADLGIPIYPAADLRGGGREENARIVRDVLGGRGKAAARDIVAVNAGAALYVAGEAGDIRDGTERAQDAIASGLALEKLGALVDHSGRAA